MFILSLNKEQDFKQHAWALLNEGKVTIFMLSECDTSAVAHNILVSFVAL